jgi:hypothetical protein
MENFYEFMLDDIKVVDYIEKQGFECVLRKPHDATKGIKDEIKFLKPLLKKIYNGRNVFWKGLRYILSIIFASFAGHIILLVFRKKDE